MAEPMLTIHNRHPAACGVPPALSTGAADLPWVPARQQVLTLPYRLRYLMAWNHGLSRAVLRVHTRVLLDVYRRGARARGVHGGQSGMVTAVQRAGAR